MGTADAILEAVKSKADSMNFVVLEKIGLFAHKTCAIHTTRWPRRKWKRCCGRCKLCKEYHRET